MLEIIKSLLIAFFAVAVLLPIVRYALRRLSPPQHVTAMSADELKYIQKQELKLTIAYFFFATLLTVFSAGVLALLSSIIHASEEHMYVLTPNFRALFAPGLLLGLTLAVLPLRLAQSALLGNDYELYKSYTQQVEGQHSIRVYRILLLVLLAVSGIVTFYALRWHVTIDEEEVHVTNLLLEQRAYDMQEIESIRYLGTEGEYLVSFSDQTNLNTTYLKPVQLEMIALLAAQSDTRVIR
ncbi:hypothetical protein GCM10027443_42300 [Pontibacter brevis]